MIKNVFLVIWLIGMCTLIGVGVYEITQHADGTSYFLISLFGTLIGFCFYKILESTEGFPK